MQIFKICAAFSVRMYVLKIVGWIIIVKLSKVV